MSSRAVRKTAGHTTKDDLAQVLQKVGISKHGDDDDDESDLIASAGTNQRWNAFEMLADDDENNNEKEGNDSDNQVDNEVQQQQQSKTKRKRKAKKKNAPAPKTDEVMI